MKRKVEINQFYFCVLFRNKYEVLKWRKSLYFKISEKRNRLRSFDEKGDMTKLVKKRVNQI